MEAILNGSESTTNYVEVMNKWEGAVLTPEGKLLSEETRCGFANQLERKRVDLSGFRDGRVKIRGRERTRQMAESNKTLSAQVDFLRAALGDDRFKKFLAKGTMKTLALLGGELDDDVLSGAPEPTNEAMTEFLNNYLETQMKRKTGFLFAPKSQFSEDPWKRKLTYRFEAVASLSYGMLQLMSFKEAEAAVEYQKCNYFNRFVKQRMIRGWIKANGTLAIKNNQPRAYLDQIRELRTMLSREEIVRPVPIGTVGMLMEMLLDEDLVK